MRRHTVFRRIRPLILLPLVAVPAAALMGAGDPGPPTCTDPAPKSVRTDPRAPLTVLASCIDPSSSGVTMVVEQAPLHGTLEHNPNSPYAVAYMPAKGFHGQDAFTYHVTSANGTSNTVEQRITVDPAYNQEPWCNPTTFAVREGRAASHYVDCFDPDADDLTLTVKDAPQHGSAEPEGYRDVRYTAGTGHLGDDAFTLEADDGHGGKAIANVTVTITDRNQAPICREHHWFARSAKTDPIHFAGACHDPDGDPITFAVVTQPPHGMVSRPDGGAWQVITEAFVGTDRFTMLADDGVDQTRFDVVLTVTESLDTIPECASARSEVAAGATVTIQLQCFDRDGDVPRLEIREGPAPGTGALEPIAQQPQTVRFTADPSFTGTARFAYGAADPSGPSAPATVEIEVRDGTAPDMKLTRAARQGRRTVVARGVAMVVRVDEPAALSVRALVDPKAARRLGIARRARRPVEVGRAARSVSPGRTTVRVRLNRRAGRALRRSRAATTIRLAATATDAAGNRRALPSRVVVR